MIAAFEDGFNLVKQFIRLLKSDSLVIGTRELARAYAKVELKFLCSAYLKSQPEPAENILGYKFKLLTYDSFRYLFLEIFLNRDYCFVTDKESPLIIDCGTNIGVSILYFKKLYPQARIVGFEPFAQAFNVLKSNVEVNNLQNVTVHNLGLTGQDGERALFHDPANGGGLRTSFLEQRARGASTVVTTTVLSKYIDQPVDFLKMDIEGSELPVIEELAQTRKLSLVNEMVIEYHHHITKDADCLARMLSILEENDFGYQLRGNFMLPLSKGQFQDILLYAYRKPL